MTPPDEGRGEAARPHLRAERGASGGPLPIPAQPLAACGVHTRPVKAPSPHSSSLLASRRLSFLSFLCFFLSFLCDEWWWSFLRPPSSSRWRFSPVAGVAAAAAPPAGLAAAGAAALGVAAAGCSWIGASLYLCGDGGGWGDRVCGSGGEIVSGVMLFLAQLRQHDQSSPTPLTAIITAVAHHHHHHPKPLTW